MYKRLCNLLNNNSFFLFGARGVGKSTLISTELGHEIKASVNLLKDDEFSPLSDRPDALIERLGTLARGDLVFIDEIQRVPALLNTVHLLIEERGLRFAMTGSSSRKLKRGGSNLLAGRASLRELFPLTHVEYGDDFELSSVLRWGSLPTLSQRSTDTERADYLTSYVNTYLREEIIAEQLVRKLPPFRRFLDIAAQMNGKILNYTAIGREVGVASDTIKQYVSVLVETHIGLLLESYHRSIRKRQTQSPKFYLFDTGLPRAIQRLPGAPLAERTSAYGDTFEQFIILEIYRLCSYMNKRADFFYLRTKDDAEIDLIVEFPGQAPVLIEVKSSRSITAQHVTGLNKFAADIANSGVFCLSQDAIPKKIGAVDVLHWKDGIKHLVGY